MSSTTNRTTLSPMLLFLLTMAGTTFAGDLVWPLQVGQRYEYNKSDNSGAQWPVYIEVTSQITYNSLDYFEIKVWNYDNDGAIEDIGDFRSTETAWYRYNPNGNDYEDFRKAPVGTTWSYFEPGASGMNYIFMEIIAVEPVTVPYGTFNTAYVTRKCLCVSPDGSGARSPYWYNWIVPGVGYVKEVDYYAKVGEFPPMIMELVNIVEENISEHVFSIGISNSWDYEDPSNDQDIKYEFGLYIETDGDVNKVEFLTPAGYTFEIPRLAEQWDDTGTIWTNWEFNPEFGCYNWEYEAAFTNPSDLDVYGDGSYTIKVFYADGSDDETTVWFGIPDSKEPIPQPTQEPVLTFPSHHEVVESPVTFCWEACTDSEADKIWLDLQKEETAEELQLDFSTDRTCSKPVVLTDGSWQTQLDFVRYYHVPDNGNGIEVKVWKCIEADYRFEVVPPAEIEVKLRGTNIDDGQTEPIDFGTVAQYTSPQELKFTIENVGGMSLEVGTVYLHNNSGFEITRQPDSNIEPYSGTFFKVKMLTSILGGTSADIEFSNSDSDENPFNFTVVGTVEEPYIDLITDVQFAQPVPPYVFSGRKNAIDIEVLVANNGNITDDTKIDIEIFARPVGAVDDSQDILIEVLPDYCQVPPPAPVPPGYDNRRKLRIYLPADMAAGEYHLGVNVDSSDEVNESNEHNNTALTAESIRVVDPYIDLITAVQFKEPVPPYVVSGYPPPIRLKLMLGNIGNITVDTRMDVDIFARPAGAADDSQDVLVETLNCRVLPPHRVIEDTITIGLPPGMTAGRYIFGVKVDSSNKVDESNEDNNTALTEESITVVEPYADLIAGVWFRGQVPSPVVPGTPIELVVAVRNIGELKIVEKVDVEIFARPAGAVDDSYDVLVKTYSCYVPPPRRTDRSVEIVFWPSGMVAGEYHLGVKVDSSNKVEEYRENNNTGLTKRTLISTQ